MGPNIMDEIDCGNFFDQIDDLIEFSPDSECGGGDGNFVISDDPKDFPSVWNDAFSGSGTLFSNENVASDLSVPYEDIVQLEWLSTFMEDSFSGGGLTLGKENVCSTKEPSNHQLQTLSPVSVLESSSSSSTSSCLGGKTMPLSPSHRGPQRARSKRPRPATFNPRAAIQLILPSSAFVETPPTFVPRKLSSQSENFAESLPLKKKKVKVTLPANREESHPNTSSPSQVVRKCLHCEITKTPQWRAGPMGPKTLCNACGVRYKSGRLYPEYRPAASPTFVPSLHSNSHKKVVEMRNKNCGGTMATTIPVTTLPEHVSTP